MWYFYCILKDALLPLPTGNSQTFHFFPLFLTQKGIVTTFNALHQPKVSII